MSDQPPLCLACRYRPVHPCRPGGIFDPDRLAEGMIDYLRAGQITQDSEARRQSEWAQDCLSELCFHSPDPALDIVLLVMIGLEHPAEAVALARGPLQMLVSSHGARLIERIEALADASPRFCSLLGVLMAHGKQETEAWQRLEAARRTAPVLDPQMPLAEVGLIAPGP